MVVSELLLVPPVASWPKMSAIEKLLTPSMLDRVGGGGGGGDVERSRDEFVMPRSRFNGRK